MGKLIKLHTTVTAYNRHIFINLPKTEYNDKTQKNEANILSWYALWSMLLSEHLPHAINSSHLLRNLKKPVLAQWQWRCEKKKKEKKNFAENNAQYSEYLLLTLNIFHNLF